MKIKDFKFFEKDKEPRFQFRESQMIATNYVERVYSDGTYRNLREVDPHHTHDGTYHITNFNVISEDNMIKIESNVVFQPITPITSITLNVSFTDHYGNINSF